MGIDYGFQVYAHQRDAGRFLTALAALCDTDRRTTVLLPDGSAVALPASYGFKDGRTVALADVVAGRDRSAFDLTLCFPEDAPLREYLSGEPNAARPAGVALGYVYLSVFDGSSVLPEHWYFDFTPATSTQSRLFLSSPSIRRTFATLALSTGAPLCLLDVEEEYRMVVTARDEELSTQVPGPCVLWHGRAPGAEAYQELLAPETPPRWIVRPGQPGYEPFVESLTRNSSVPGIVR